MGAANAEDEDEDEDDDDCGATDWDTLLTRDAPLDVADAMADDALASALLSSERRLDAALPVAVESTDVSDARSDEMLAARDDCSDASDCVSDASDDERPAAPVDASDASDEITEVAALAAALPLAVASDTTLVATDAMLDASPVASEATLLAALTTSVDTEAMTLLMASPWAAASAAKAGTANTAKRMVIVGGCSGVFMKSLGFVSVYGVLL